MQGQAPSLIEKCVSLETYSKKKKKKKEEERKRRKQNKTKTKKAKHKAGLLNLGLLGTPLIEAGNPTNVSQESAGSLEPGHKAHGRFSKCKKIHCFAGLRPVLDLR